MFKVILIAASLSCTAAFAADKPAPQESSCSCDHHKKGESCDCEKCDKCEACQKKGESCESSGCKCEHKDAHEHAH